MVCEGLRIMNIMKAIQYPFTKGRFVSVLFVPSVLILLASVVMVLPMMGMIFMNPALMGLMSDPALLADPAFNVDSLIAGLGMSLAIGFGIGMLLCLLLMMPVYGYFWDLIRNWQLYGMDCPAPRWKGNMKGYFAAGCHMFLASIVLSIPMTLASLPLGLLVPFLMAGYFMAASKQQFTCMGVLKNIIPGLQASFRRAGPSIIAFYVGLLLGIPYYIGISIGSMVLIGGPLIMMAYMVTFLYLMTEGYGFGPEKAQEIPNLPTLDVPDMSPELSVQDTSAMDGPQAEHGEEGGTMTMVVNNSSQAEADPEQVPVESMAMNNPPQTEAPHESMPVEGNGNGGSVSDRPAYTDMMEEDPVEPHRKDKPVSKATADTYNMKSGDNPWLRYRKHQ